MSKESKVSRRGFIGSVSMLALGAPFISFKVLRSYSGAGIAGMKLWDEFSPEELELIKKSERAGEIVKIDWGSCAEKVLLTTIRSFNKPEDLVSMAASFGGGIKRKDLCGALTGAFMSIGLAGEVLIEDKTARPAWVKEKTLEFWDWWEAHAPIHCNDLRSLYASENKTIHKARFNRMLQRIALKLDEMFVA